MLVSLALADSGTSLAAPSGWTVKFGPTTNASVMWTVAYVLRGGSAPSLVWNVTGTSKYREIYVLCLTAGGTTITFDSVSAAGGTGGGTNHAPDPPSTTAVASSSLAVAGGLNFFGSQAGGWAASTGYVVRSNNAAGNDGFMETKSLSASGAEDPSATNAANGNGDWWDGFTMTFTDAGGGATRGLFLPPTLTGLGAGGSFFPSPI